MRRLLVTLIAIVASGTTYAQDVEGQPNVDYDHLKALQPLVGEWHVQWTTPETGQVTEARSSIVWSRTKMMIIVTSKTRSATTVEELAKQQWHPGLHAFYVWNDSAGRIECYRAQSDRGSVATLAVQVDGDGTVRFQKLATTKETGSADVTLKLGEERMYGEYRNRKTTDGTELPDLKLTFRRVKE